MTTRYHATRDKLDRSERLASAPPKCCHYGPLIDALRAGAEIRMSAPDIALPGNFPSARRSLTIVGDDPDVEGAGSLDFPAPRPIGSATHLTVYSRPESPRIYGMVAANAYNFDAAR